MRNRATKPRRDKGEFPINLTCGLGTRLASITAFRGYAGGHDQEEDVLLALRRALLGVAAVFGLGTDPAAALTLGFDCITNNLAGDCGIGAAQLTVEVTDSGPGEVTFTFRNAGPLASSITDVYFDHSDTGALLEISTIVDSSGVDFGQGATPNDLPGGNDASPPFSTTNGFSADSESPAVQANGVNPGENVIIVFLLKAGKSFDDVLATLEDGSLRVGIHVQGFTSGGSEGFVNTPEPYGLGLVAVGLLVLAVRIRRR
jgi:hypothetical protein